MDCPIEACYVGIPQSPIPVIPGGRYQPLRPPCCLVQQTQVTHIQGGKFSLQTKSGETAEEATAYWNPGCADALTVTVFYTNLLQGAIGESLRRGQRVAGDLRPCGGVCTPEQPVCRQVRPRDESVPHPDFVPGGFLQNSTCRNTPSSDVVDCPAFDTGYSCTVPQCSDVRPFCARESPIGLRARQICSQTCGCHLPHSTLALTQPSSGCPEKCREISQFRDTLVAAPCVDLPKTDPTFVGFLDNWRANANNWPKDWKDSSIIFVDLFRRYGCNYLNIYSPADDPSVNYTATVTENATHYALDPSTDNPSGEFWPPNFAGSFPGSTWGINPCIDAGTFYPVKPFSFFCPVACGCRAGDIGCPDSCPARMIDRNGQGQVMYSGLEPNPSPRNVPHYAWRYSNTSDNWQPNITALQVQLGLTQHQSLSPAETSYGEFRL